MSGVTNSKRLSTTARLTEHKIDKGFESQGPTPPALLPLSVTDNEVALRGFSDFDYKFNDNVAFYNDTEIIWSSSDTYIWNEVGITASSTQ